LVKASVLSAEYKVYLVFDSPKKRYSTSFRYFTVKKVCKKLCQKKDRKLELSTCQPVDVDVSDPVEKPVGAGRFTATFA
jgi:hypothetical protein